MQLVAKKTFAVAICNLLIAASAAGAVYELRSLTEKAARDAIRNGPALPPSGNTDTRETPAPAPSARAAPSAQTATYWRVASGSQSKEPVV